MASSFTYIASLWQLNMFVKLWPNLGLLLDN